MLFQGYIFTLDDFYIFQCNTSLYKKSVVNMSIRLHNSLPSELKELGDFKKFKRP
jgi:hypothetical protein